MRGVNVITDGLDVVARESEFEFLFGPVIPRLSELHWVFEEFYGLPIGPFFDDLCELAMDEMSQDYAPPGTLFPFCAKCIKNDWLYFYGFCSKPDTQEFFSGLQRARTADGQMFKELQRMKRSYEAAMTACQSHLHQHSSEAGRFLEGAPTFASSILTAASGSSTAVIKCWSKVCWIVSPQSQV